MDQIAAIETLETIINDNTDHFVVLPYDKFMIMADTLKEFPECREKLIERIGQPFNWYKVNT
jgi:hypothetical protein